MMLERRALTAGLLGALFLSACALQQEEALLQAQRQLTAQLQSELAADQAEITLLQGELKVTLRDTIMFPEGGYEIGGRAEETLNKLVPTLARLQQTRVVVNGFTDNVPIGPALRSRFPSNWQLSSARADGVVQYLARRGVNPNLLSAQGFGDTRPVASNDTPAGRARNRRIEVTLVGPGT